MSSETETSGVPTSEDIVGDYAVTPVPATERRTLLNLFFVYSGVLAVIAAIFGGGVLGAGLAFADMIVVVLIAALILAVIGSLTAAMGGYTGCSTYVNMRYPFGRVGAWIAGFLLITITTGIGWFAFEAWLFGVITDQLFPNVLIMGVGVAALWGGLVMTSTAVVGYRGLSLISYLTVPAFILIALVGVWSSVATQGGFGELLDTEPAAPMPLTQGVTAAVGLYIAGAIVTSDIGRFARRPSHGAVAWAVQIFTIFPVLLIGGGVMVLMTGTEQIAASMAALGMGIGAFVMAILGMWTTNDNNLYSGALAVSNFTKIRKAYITLTLGVIGSVIAAAVGFGWAASMDPFVEFITWLGRFLPAVAGVMIADFYIVRPFLEQKRDPRSRYVFEPGAEYSQINLAGVIALFAGALIGGGLIPGIALPGIEAVSALVLGFVFHIVLVWVFQRAKVRYELGTYVHTSTGF